MSTFIYRGQTFPLRREVMEFPDSVAQGIIEVEDGAFILEGLQKLRERRASAKFSQSVFFKMASRDEPLTLMAAALNTPAETIIKFIDQHSKQLSKLSNETKKDDTMSNELTIKMAELVDATMMDQGLVFYSLADEELGDALPILTYKSFDKFEVGDTVLVEDSGLLVSREIVEILDSQPLNYDRPKEYKWIKGQLDKSSYEQYKSHAKSIENAIKLAQRELHKKTVIERVLGADFEPPKLGKL